MCFKQCRTYKEDTKKKNHHPLIASKIECKNVVKLIFIVIRICWYLRILGLRISLQYSALRFRTSSPSSASCATDWFLSSNFCFVFVVVSTFSEEKLTTNIVIFMVMIVYYKFIPYKK